MQLNKKIKASHIKYAHMFVVLLVVIAALTFQPTFYAASLIQPNCVIAVVSPNCGGLVEQCTLGSQVAQAWLWTPIILLNSPYLGSATGTKSISVSSSFTIVSGDPSVTGAVIMTSNTETVSSATINASDGGAAGYFELDQWTIYQAVTKWVAGVVDNPCTQPYVAKITATSYPAMYYSASILPPGTQSDENEPTSVSHDGYSSVTFYNGYSYESGKQDVCYPVSVSTSTTQVTSISISVAAQGNSASGTFGETTSSSSAYSYNFPVVGTWYWQTLDTPYNNGALAFKYVGPSC